MEQRYHYKRKDSTIAVVLTALTFYKVQLHKRFFSLSQPNPFLKYQNIICQDLIYKPCDRCPFHAKIESQQRKEAPTSLLMASWKQTAHGKQAAITTQSDKRNYTVYYIIIGGRDMLNFFSSATKLSSEYSSNVLFELSERFSSFRIWSVSSSKSRSTSVW